MNRQFPRILAVLIGVAFLVTAARGQQNPFDGPPRSVRTRDFDSLHLRLDLAFSWENRSVQGTAALRFRPFRELRVINLDAVDLQVKSASITYPDGTEKQASFRTLPEVLQIEPPERLLPNREYTVTVAYTVQSPRRGVHFVLPGPKEPHKHRVVWTQNEPEYARYWIPCFDSPNDRLTSETVVTVPSGMFVLSNGVLKGKQDNGNGTTTWHWAQEDPHVVYLISVVAGTFVPYEQRWKDIPIISYVPPEYIDLAPNSFANTPAMMDLFSRLIGVKYPWPKYAQICCDEYGGGMEHTSATTLTLSTLHDDRAHLDVSSDSLVAHELAHQWWGDLLTCKDWAEIWLNESFATYFASLWTEHHEGWDEATWERYQHLQSYLREANRYLRPIVTYRYRRPDFMFDRHTYPKGARVLHFLRFVLGDEQFFRAIRYYARKNRQRVVETADFRTAIEESTGVGLNWLFDDWIYGAGHPVFTASGEWNGGDGTFKVTVEQTHEQKPGVDLFRVPLEIEFLFDGGRRRVERVTVDEKREVFVFSLGERPLTWCFDGPDWVPDIHRIERPVQEWKYRAVHDPHLLCRHEAIEQLDQDQHRQEAFDVLAKVAREDAFWAVRSRAVDALARVGGPEARDVLVAILQHDPRSSVRRAAARALARYRGDKVVEALLAATRDRSYYVVAEALQALANVDPERARPLLKEAIGWSSHQEVILRAAANSLANLGDKTVLPRLIKTLEGPSTWQQRVAVYQAAVKLSEGQTRDRIVQLLLEELNDPRRAVRQAAAAALAQTASPEALQALRRQLSEETWPYMRESLQSAIESLEREIQQRESLDGQVRRLQDRLQTLEQQLRAVQEKLQQK